MEERDSYSDILEELHRLRTRLEGDYCALGALEGGERTLAWKLASGNANERFRSISERAGRGLNATVVTVGRAMPLQFAELVATRRLHEYPLLIAENLRSAYAAPVYRHGILSGVLLAGERKRRVYRPDERERIAEAAMRIGERWPEETFTASSADVLK